MVDLRDLRCLDMLARHRHFARAAAACGLSQPAFSARIGNLEARFGTMLVQRGNRFQGLTAEGETLLRHARGILDQVKAMDQAFAEAGGAVAGTLALGVIPTALGMAARLTAALHARHPGIRVRLDTASSLAIQQGIADGRFDAGLSYGDGTAAEYAAVLPLYDETYALLAPAALVPAETATITWAEAATRPLVLLAPSMQNRRILDDVFDRVGATPHVVAETSGFTASMAMVAQGFAAAIVPRALLDAVQPPPGAVALPLEAPVEARAVGLLTPRRGAVLPTVTALQDVAAAMVAP